MPRRFVKDPSAVLDYSIDWSDYLSSVSPEDTISTSTWSVDNGITIDSSDNSDSVTTVWLSGGTRRRRYRCTNNIVTAGGRTDERSIVIYVQDR